PGVAVARAYCMDEVLARREPHHLDAAAADAEIKRLDAACAAAAQELDSTIARVTTQVGEDEAAIFRAHRLLLRDPALSGQVKPAILNGHMDARSALQEALDEYTALFAQIQDDYLRERMADLRDVISRIATHLTLQAPCTRHCDLNEPVILIASEI